MTRIVELKVGQGTHEGMVGKNNEDSLGFSTTQYPDGAILHLGVVADGVGGQTAGEMASRLAVETITTHFENLSEVSDETILDEMRAAIAKANTVVHERAQKDDNLQGMATTVVVAGVLNGRLFTSHVGDSRIYLWRDEKLMQLSKDHSWVQEAMEAGLLTEEQARVHPNRNVIRRSLGSLAHMPIDQELQSPGETDFNQGLPLLVDDLILLCSDGLTDMIDDAAVKASLQNYPDDLSSTVDDLINRANLAGGRDNISVILMQVPPESEQTAPSPEPPSAESPQENQVEEREEGPVKPRVVSVPLDKAEREQAKIQRRITIILAVSILIALLILAALFFEVI